MFPLAMVVTVTDGLVVFAIRTGEERVDEYTFAVDEFRLLLGGVAHKPNGMVHVYLWVAPTKREIYCVTKPDFDVMVAQFEAQVKG